MRHPRRWWWILPVVGACVNFEDPPAMDSGALSDLPGEDARDAQDATEDRAVTDVPSVIEVPRCEGDRDGDGLTDESEGAPALDTDGDGMADYLDPDSDEDGFPDAEEALRRYPGFEARARARGCASAGDNCDAPPDTLPNHRDPDSDNDGLTDAEERASHTNPCAEDTDEDGAGDLVEVAARSDPTVATSRPSDGTLYVTLPYYAPGTRGPHEHRQFTFQTRIRQADLFFLVDNSASMGPTIDNLRRNLATVIIPGVRAAIPDIRVGVASFDSMPDGTPSIPGDGMPGTPGDYTLWLRQRLTADVSASQGAFDVMRTIDADTSGQILGGDGPEDQVEALYELVEGTGSRMHEADPAALRSVVNALDPTGNGWVPAVDVARDCPGLARAFGWGCFQEGRVPIVVMASDSAWYDGPVMGSPVSYLGHRYPDLVTAMNRRGAFFVGVDVGMGTRGLTYQNSELLARATRTQDDLGNPVLFGPGSAGLEGASMNIVTAITTLAQRSRQDITTVTASDPAETRLPSPHRTGDFIVAVTPVRGEPEAPAGYTRRDDRTFYGVLPSTSVVFDVDFYNDFQVGGTAAQVFQASIVVQGRAGSEVDRRPVYIVVPSRGGGLPPG